MGIQLFRAMRDDGGRPLVRDTASGLGVRDDEVLYEDGSAMPGTGGMSVSPDSPFNLPPSFRPPEFHGSGRHPIWVLDEDELGDLLIYRADPDNPQGHGYVEPRHPMDLEEYRLALAETRDAWRKCH